MPYGTDAFVDGYGDFKQPTVIDYDKQIVDGSSYHSTPEQKQKILEQYESDQHQILQEILDINPVFGGPDYQHLTFAKDNKLHWNIDKINTLKENVDWLYEFARVLKKRKKLQIFK